MKQQLSTRIFIMIMLTLAGLSFAVLPAIAETPKGSEKTTLEAIDSGIVAYYFHGNFRCATCRKLEAYSEEAITKGFADELKSGELIWRTVNTDETENKHFTEDFQLVTKSVVLVKYKDGKVEDFKNLKLVWQLVGDEEGFIRYVRNETRSFIEPAE
jgi:hypothetical protein